MTFDPSKVTEAVRAKILSRFYSTENGWRLDADGAAAAALPVIVAAVTDEVRALHHERHGAYMVRDANDGLVEREYHFCRGCGATYPCPTVRLLDAIDIAAGRETT